MLRRLINRLLGRTSEGEVDPTTDGREPLDTQPAHDGSDDRAAGEAADAAIRTAGDTPHLG
jgi:hypothetical protein